MILKKIVNTIDSINRKITSFTMWLIIPMMCVMLYDAIMRYFFHAQSVWGYDTALMLFGLYMLYAGPASIIEKSQVGVDLFSSRWSKRTQAIVRCVTYIFTFTFFICLAKISFTYGIESWVMKERSISAWGQPIYHWKMLIPIAISLSLLQTFSEFLSNLWTACTGKDL